MDVGDEESGAAVGEVKKSQQNSERSYQPPERQPRCLSKHSGYSASAVGIQGCSSA
jgi:hypothetical protein